MNNKIRFKELSIPLKFGMIASWIIGMLYIIGFTIGFIIGLSS